MPLIATVRFVNLFAVGLVAGILFGDWMGTTPVRPTMSGPSFTQYQQGLHTHFVPLMPILMFTGILSGLAALVLMRRHYRDGDFVLTAAGCLGIIAVLVITRVVNVPINNILMTWMPASPPENWKEVWRPWEQAHSARTVIALAAFACLGLACLIPPRGPAPGAGVRTEGGVT